MRETRDAISLVVSTDEPVLELGLQALFAGDPEFSLVRVCCDEELIAAAAEHHPDLVVCNISSDAEFSKLPELRAAAPNSEIVLWSREFPIELTRQAVDLGVRGFLSTSAKPDMIRECLRTAARGGMWMENTLSMTLLNVRPLNLSRRQMQLIGLLVQGLRNKEIAALLGISEGTVKSYLTTLYERVGAKCRFELALFGLRNMRHLREASLEPDGYGLGRMPSAPRLNARRTAT